MTSLLQPQANPTVSNKPTRSTWMSYKKSNLMVEIILSVFLLIVGISMILPFLWTLSAAFKREIDVFSFPVQWIPTAPSLESFQKLFGGFGAAGVIPFDRAYLNTILVTIPGVIGPLVTSALAAYAFARLRFPGRDKIFLLYLATLMVPIHVLIIPRFMIIRWMGLYNSLWSLVVQYMFVTTGVFLLRQAFIQVPQDLIDAAKIDGAGHLRIIWNVFVPSCKASLAALAMMLFVWRWNDFLTPLVMINRQNLYTITLALATFVEDHANVQYAPLMAATVLSTFPLLIIFIFANRYFVESLTSVGVKG